MHPFFVHRPTLPPQERPHPTVTVAGVLAGEADHPLHESPIISCFLTYDVALAGSRLTDGPACPTLGDPKLPSYVLDGRSPPGRAQKFPWLTSLRMLMSTAWSATIFFKRAFSFSRSFRRFMESVCMPP